MFKQSKTGLLIQRTVNLQHQRRQITTKQLVPSIATLDQKRASLLTLTGECDGNLGVVKMNKEHRFNTLSEGLIKDLIRGLVTMDNDHIMHGIYLGSEKGAHFSNGTDFRTIQHMKRENEYSRIQNYLEQLYGLQTHVAHINKPLFAVAAGHSFNSGASLLAACGHPMTTLDSKISFNEVSFGFVPHSGASFYQSRMKGEFGTFMAVTGLPIHGTDAVNIDLARGIVHEPADYHQEISDHISSLPMPLIGGKETFKRNRGQKDVSQWQKKMFQKFAESHQLEMSDLTRYGRQRGNHELEDNLRTNLEDRIGSSTAEAEYRYMRQIKHDARRMNQEEESWLEQFKNDPARQAAFPYRNYYTDVMSYVEPRIGNSWSKFEGVASNHQMLIDRCFRSNSVEEIIQNLRKETHPFAKECLKAMERNSPQSMQLALMMVRKAQNLDYKGCLQMELNVAFNRFNDKDFDLGCSEILSKPKPKGQKWHNTPEWQRPLQESQLQRYFEPHPQAEGVNLNVVEHALLPTKHFYKRFADPVRLYVNESSTTSPTIREAFEREMKNSLHELGVDVRNLALTPENVREHLAAKLAQERVQEKQIERFEQLMHDTKLREEYFGQISQELDKYEKDEFFYDKVNKHIEETFQLAFMERLNKIFERSTEAHSLEKRRMFLRLKKFYFRERILQYNEENIQLATKQLQSLPFQQPHLTEKWDQSWREQSNPQLWRSPLSYLSKAIGRVSLTMPELAKTYLTDPDQRDQMTMFTLDKQELEKLNSDILQNPEKYLFIFEGTNQPELEKGFEFIKWTRDLEHAKHEELEHWYRIFNDGKCPMDSFPYIQQYNEYKHWVDQIEYKALGTLRAAVNKLLIDHEQVTEFSGPLKKLHSLASQTHKSLKEGKKRRSDTQSRMGQPRPVEEIEKSITGMLQSDPHFSKIFDQYEKNAQVLSLQKEFKNEILQATQLVLLDKHADFRKWSDDEKKEMAQVLSQLTDPDYKEQGQLNLIDQFLRKKNGEALIRDVFRLIAPFVNESFGRRLDEEAQKVLKRIQWEDKSHDYLFYYFMNKNYPNFHKNPVLQKITNFNSQEFGQQLARAIAPHLEETHMRKEMQAVFGSREINYSQDLEEMKAEALAQTREELEQYQKFEEMANQPKPHYEPEDFTDAKVFNSMGLTDQEYREIIALQKQVHEMFNWMYKHKYEIDHHMTQWDNIKLIGNAYEEHELDISRFMDQPQQKKLWDSQAQYANFLWQMKKGLDEYAREAPIDGVNFIEHHRTESPQAASLYYAARQERDRVKALKDKQRVGTRRSIIANEISDFNSLQMAISKSDSLLQHLRTRIRKIGGEKQSQIEDFLSNQRNYIDFELLQKQMDKSDYTFLQNPSLVCNVDKMFNAAKHDILKLDSAVDVVSLNQLRQTVRNDFSANQEMAQLLLNLIEHVDQNSKYLSNQQRQAISVKDYFEKHHFTSYQAYQQYANDLLQHKVSQLLGEANEKETAMVDWQLGVNRTLPSEHQINEAVDSVLHRDDIQSIHDKEPATLSSGLLGKEMIEKDAKQPEQQQLVDYTNPLTGKVETMTVRDLMNKKAYREAQTLVQLPRGMEPTRNLYENLLLKEMIEPVLRHQRTEELVDEYIQMRFKGAMANPRFAQVMQTDDAHLYIKVLREECVIELGLNQETKPSQLSLQSLEHVFHNQLFMDPENTYNLQTVNNEHAIGYDNLEQRSAAQSPDGNFTSAHTSIFDKLLSDYFLSKRGEYKEMNTLANDLAKVFEHPHIAKSSNGNAMDHLHSTKLEQDVGKGLEPRLTADTFRDLINLDVLTHRVLQKNKNGLSKELSQLSIKEVDHPDYHSTQVPEYFPMLDCRKPADLYVEDKMRLLVKECFDIRANVEKKMTRSELAAFDRTLAKFLQKDKLVQKLREAIDSDYHWCDTAKSLVNHVNDNEESLNIQGRKQKHDQRAYNKKIKNEDAWFKELSFAAIRDKDTAELAKKNREWTAMYNNNSFDQYYKEELRQDVQRPPREINPSHYEPRKPWDRPVGTPYKSEEERIQDLHSEYKLYQERKLEQQERIRLFYILEQFNEEARRNPDPTSAGQQAIKEYFADPENTYFFDKNKLM